MGIPVLFKTLIDDYSSIIKPVNGLSMDNIFFDLNCLIHPMCAGETDESGGHPMD